MTSKERMMLALNREKPDRLPVTIHQWQGWHLERYMNGIDDLTAFRETGMDAAIQYFAAMGQFWIPDAEKHIVQTDQWREDIDVVSGDPDNKILHHTIHTPSGTLTYKTGGNRKTTWITEYLIKRDDDLDIIERYMPVARLDRKAVESEYERVGDEGILRGFVWGDQAGCWQHAACLMNIQDLILKALDDPTWVHRLLRSLLNRKLQFIDESLRGAKFDLIETGGGSASDTVISPALHAEFCLPYDRALHDALHVAGHRVVYHTCGGMLHILDHIRENGADASETLAPPGVGGNIEEPAVVRDAFAGRLAMIGGMDQFNVLTNGDLTSIRKEVERLFTGFGPDGGYIMAASDHFFDAPVRNLRAYAEAAKSCVY